MKLHVFKRGACLGLHLEDFPSPPQASEHERHRAEMLEQWEEEKAERKREHQKLLLEIKREIATLQAQKEEDQTRFEKAKREVMFVKGELV